MDTRANHYDRPREGSINRGDVFAPSRDQCRTCVKEERNIRSAAGGQGLQLVSCRATAMPAVDVGHGQKCGGRIARASAKSGARGDALADGYLCAAFIVGETRSIEAGCAVDDVLFGFEGYFRTTFDRQGFCRFDVENVRKVDGHEDRFDIVIPIGPTAENAQAEVDLGAAGNGKRKERHVGTNIVHK